MHRILFICHGNICRSVAAQYIMQDLVNRAGLQDLFEIDSAAATREEIGNPIYPPMGAVLKAHGVPVGTHRARLMTGEDYAHFDVIVGMDYENMHDMNRKYGEAAAGGAAPFRWGYSYERIRFTDPEGKLSLLMDETDRPGEVSDPWYTRDFEQAFRDIEEGCKGLLARLTSD